MRILRTSSLKTSRPTSWRGTLPRFKTNDTERNRTERIIVLEFDEMRRQLIRLMIFVE